MVKNILIAKLTGALFVILLSSSTSFAQDLDKKGLAKVQKVQGKEVYIMSEPVKEYDVIETINTQVMQSLTGDASIEKMVKTMVERANNKEKKGKIKPFDAIITSDGETAILIKFKE